MGMMQRLPCLVITWPGSVRQDGMVPNAWIGFKQIAITCIVRFALHVHESRPCRWLWLLHAQLVLQSLSCLLESS